MHSLTHKPKLGSSDIEQLHRRRRLKTSRLYLRPHHRDSPWWRLSRRCSGGLLPLWVPSTHHWLRSCLWFSIPRLNPSQLGPMLGHQGGPWQVPGEEAAPHLLPAPRSLPCRGRAFACSWRYPSVPHLEISTHPPLKPNVSWKTKEKSKYHSHPGKGEKEDYR